MITVLSILVVLAFGAMIVHLVRALFARGRRVEMMKRASLLFMGWIAIGFTLALMEEPGSEKATGGEVRTTASEAPSEAEQASKCGSDSRLCDDERDIAKTASDTKDQDDCEDRIACIVEEHKNAAQVACNPAIEDMGNYTSRWTNSWYEPRYSHIYLNLEQENTLTMFGDSIEFQNAFGAWAKVSYVCVYDFVSRKVLTVSGEAGRLDL
jgi:hypothetical protein